MYVPSASIYHWVPTARMTTNYFCQRAFNQGISDSYSAIRRNSGIGFSLASRQSIINLRQLTGAGLFLWSGFPVRERRSCSPCATLMLRSAIADKKRDKEIADAYRKGYEFHQRAAKDDEILRSWILRANYWNCEIPSSIENLAIYNGVLQDGTSE